jgi:pyrroloquinoline-quinone synthase
MYMKHDIIQRIDSEIEKRSLLKHSFYRMWSEGKLTIDHLKGYSMEYFQLVKAIPKFVESIAHTTEQDPLTSTTTIKTSIDNNAKEEAEHIEPWIRFASSLGISRNDLVSYAGTAKTNDAVSKMAALVGSSTSSFEEAVAAMYAFEMELPKISKSKIDGLKKFYNMDTPDALNYFQMHEEADVRHAQIWRDILEKIPAEKQQVAFNAAVESLKAQNALLDSVQEEYFAVCSNNMYC